MSHYLNIRIVAALGLAPSDQILWKSPIRDDGYAEYCDQEFLNRLDLPSPKVPLKSFWPSGGPCWDGLARTVSGKCILVEAKAYIGEAVDYGTHATDANSLKQIFSSLAHAKEAFNAREDAPWNSPFYQYTNRLAHLYYLLGLNDVEAYLVFVYFADAPDVPEPCSTEQWSGAIRSTKKCLGLRQNKYGKRVAELILKVPEMESMIQRFKTGDLPTDCERPPNSPELRKPIANDRAKFQAGSFHARAALAPHPPRAT